MSNAGSVNGEYGAGHAPNGVTTKNHKIRDLASMYNSINTVIAVVD